MKTIEQLLVANGADLSDCHFRDTPKRFEKWLRLAMENQGKKCPKLLREFSLQNSMGSVTVSDIQFSSLCAHHLMPFFGSISISYTPNGRVVGLSKFVRLVDWMSKRAQTQEQLARDILVAIKDQTGCGARVVIKATHTCMCCRGVENMALTTTENFIE